MGEETRQITNKLENTITSIYNKVGDIAITQATLIANVSNMHKDVKDTKSDVKQINGRVNSLESTRDENIGKSKKSATIKKSIAWGLGIVTSVGGLIFGIMRMLQ